MSLVTSVNAMAIGVFGFPTTRDRLERVLRHGAHLRVVEQEQQEFELIYGIPGQPTPRSEVPHPQRDVPTAE